MANFYLKKYKLKKMLILNSNYTKQTLKLAIPVMITQLGQVSVNLFDKMIVGRLLGKDALASVALGNSIFFSIFIIALGMSLAIPPLVSEAQSQNDKNKISKVLSHGFVINSVMGILMMLVILLTIPFLGHMGQPKHILPDTAKFLHIMAVSMIPFAIFQTFREFSEGLGYTIGVTIATIIANVINIALNYVLIKGMFGIPSLGVEGSAYATFISRIFMLIFLLIILKRESTTREFINSFSLRVEIFSKDLFRKMISLGIPTSLQMFFEVTAFAGTTFICGLVSTTDMVGHEVALTMASFTFSLCMGFGVASTIMIGNKYGEKNFVEVKKIGINSFKIVVLFMLFCGMIFIFGRDILPTFFVENKEIAVIELASKLLIIAALFQLSDGIQLIMIGCLRGLQDVKIPSIITFIAYWLFTIPLGYFLCYEMKMGAFGMWISLGLGLSISASLLVIRFFKLSSKK